MSFLKREMEGDLKAILDQFHCEAGTIHVAREGQLYLVAMAGLPAELEPVISVIPFGKGMAGLAAQRQEPVHLCNLQTDQSGDSQPGAKASGMEGSIAVPIWLYGATGRELKGVLGVAKSTAYSYSREEIDSLLRAAVALAGKL